MSSAPHYSGSMTLPPSPCWPRSAEQTSRPRRVSCSGPLRGGHRLCSTASSRRRRHWRPRACAQMQLPGGWPGTARRSRRSPLRCRRWVLNPSSTCSFALVKAPAHSSPSRCYVRRRQRWPRWRLSTKPVCPTAMSDLGAGLRLAVTTLTVLRLRPGRIDRPAARVAMTCAPLIGLAIGALAAAAAYVARELWHSSSIAALVALLTIAACSGLLHLDGLADTADGVLAPAGRDRLAIMKQPGIGAFGTAAVLFVL